MLDGPAVGLTFSLEANLSLAPELGSQSLMVCCASMLLEASGPNAEHDSRSIWERDSDTWNRVPRVVSLRGTGSVIISSLRRHSVQKLAP